jgi:endonuclease YncB( thermonuclease family)
MKALSSQRTPKRFAQRHRTGPPSSLPDTAPGWKVYKNCSLVENGYNDGDSFCVKTSRRTYVFRLYFVDAPELDLLVPERVREQAAYWDTDVETVLRLAREARRFTEDFLKDGFTVYTRKEDARGRGHRRYYALIRAGEAYLSTALVRAGLARVYGWSTDLPDGLPARKYEADLRTAERRAKREKRGGWARN